MRVIVFEDDDDKWADICNVLASKGVKGAAVRRLRSVTEFASVQAKPIDLCIIDMRMPGVAGGETRSVGLEIIKWLHQTGKHNVPVMAITAYPEEVESQKIRFASHGCIIFDYESRDSWSSAIDIYLAQSKNHGRYDFVIFTALEEERAVYQTLGLGTFDSVLRNGIDFWDFEFQGRGGTIVKLPRPGLVNATATVSHILSAYKPEVVALSGICGGFKRNAELGQLLIADVCWEYQSGKWTDDAFLAEPYQANIPEKTLGNLAKLIKRERIVDWMEEGFQGRRRPSEKKDPELVPFTTGSAVIASEARLRSVEHQHRKVAGLDMEAFGFHRAVDLSLLSPHAFTAKVVVDLADSDKDDTIHEYGCYASAKFTVDAVRHLLAADS